MWFHQTLFIKMMHRYVLTARELALGIILKYTFELTRGGLEASALEERLVLTNTHTRLAQSSHDLTETAHNTWRQSIE